MPSAHDAEIRGDWSDLKGAYYHLIYAIWVLVCDHGHRVAFYEGNDLRVRPAPIAPMLPQGPDDALPSIAISVAPTDGDIDIWVQLKATTDTWSRADLLAGNLMVNFLCNALASRRAGRDFEVRLVTQGAVKRGEVAELVARLDDPTRRQPSLAKLDKVIADVQRLCREVGEPVPTRDEVRALAREVLAQLHDTVPTSQRALQAEIERDLYRLYNDQATVRDIKAALLGTLLDDVAAGPSAAREYDQAWVERASPLPLLNRGVLDDDVVAACDRALETAAPHDWGSSPCAPREEMLAALNRFLLDPSPLFVLTGGTGMGMSWGVFDWATRVLAGRVRLMVAGDTLDPTASVAGLVVGALRPLTTARWPDEEFLRRVQAAAIGVDRGPLVVIVDGVRAPAIGEQERLGRAVARLAADCRRAGVKLILTCHAHVWALNRLAAYVPPNDLFLLNPLPASSGYGAMGEDADRFDARASFALDGLHPDEIAEIVGSRFDADIAARIAPQLSAPEFVPLRTPYLLDLYLREFETNLSGTGQTPPLPDVDQMLDGHITRTLFRVARAVQARPEAVRAAFEILVQDLWAARLTASGLDYPTAIDSLDRHLRHRGEVAFDALIKEGLLTPAGPLVLAEPTVTARLFAREMQRCLATGDVAFGELHLEVDSDVVVALLRAAADPIAYAESLLELDERWLRAVVGGLAQCSPDDMRILAFLTVLSRPDLDSTQLSRRVACEALGTLASRGARAFRWVARMYLDDREVERYRGGQALATTLNLASAQVGEIMRIRLAGVAADVQRVAVQRDQLDVNLTEALEPLYDVQHTAPARVVHEMLAIAEPLAAEIASADAEWTIDTVRGHLALVLGDTEIDRLLGDLRSPVGITRARAALALRPVAFQRSERVRDDLCDALSRETDPTVMTRLLWTAYRLSNSDPDALLDAIAAGRVVDWQTPLPVSVAALALLLLGALASRRPKRVCALLPTHLVAFSPEARAILAEPLAYAWWRCAEYNPAARQHLNALRQAITGNIPGEYYPFALRGAVLAQIGMMCVGRGYADELNDKPTAEGRELQYFTVNMDDFAARHAAELAAHEDFPTLKIRLLACVVTEDMVHHRTWHTPLGHPLHTRARHCATMLGLLAAHRPNPVPVLKDMPQEWQALHATGWVLTAGRTEQEVVAYADTLCARFERGGSANADYERQRCLTVLARLHGEASAAFDAYRRTLGRLDVGGHGLGRAFATATDGRPEEVLRLLHERVRDDRDLPLLYHWEAATRSWRSLLIARAYARMFDARPIDIDEARDLCDGLRTGLDSLADTTLHQDYVALYTAIADALNGHIRLVPPLSETSSRLGQSHSRAVSLLNEARTVDDGPTRLVNEASDPTATWETRHYSFARGSLSEHWSRLPICLLYTSPAVRLALVALGQRLEVPDPSAWYMRGRAEVDILISELDHHQEVADVHEENGEPAADMSDVEARLDEQCTRTLWDERVWEERGALALAHGDLPGAEADLTQCLNLLSDPLIGPCRRETRAIALYHIASVYARSGRLDECRHALAEAISLTPLNGRRARLDPDLEAVRPYSWFQNLWRRRLKRAIGGKEHYRSQRRKVGVVLLGVAPVHYHARRRGPRWL